ncbi:hypothetical protein D3C75_1073140 [compost metagenome]
MLELFWRDDIRMRVNPQHGQLTIVPFVEVGKRRQIHQAIAAQNDEAIRLMLVDQRARIVQLAQ